METEEEIKKLQHWKEHYQRAIGITVTPCNVIHYEGMIMEIEGKLETLYNQLIQLNNGTVIKTDD